MSKEAIQKSFQSHIVYMNKTYAAIFKNPLSVTPKVKLIYIPRPKKRTPDYIQQKKAHTRKRQVLKCS